MHKICELGYVSHVPSVLFLLACLEVQTPPDNKQVYNNVYI